MSSPPRRSHRRHASSPAGRGDEPPTYAAFSPPSSLHSPSVTGTQRSTILVQQKSPLLVATPPQITRALAYSHPFILPLNRLVGLLTWTTGDPWQSFLLVAGFWATTLYADVVTRWAGPLFVVMGLILAMYARRFSLLSSTGWTGEKKKKGHVRGASAESNTAHHKSLDDIVETLRLFTSRCNILLDPCLRLTEFLSTQTTATSATTRPALTALFVRIVVITPIWILLTLPPFYIITTKRVVLAVGTTILTWHSQPARVTRTIFWQSKTFRQMCIIVTGLDLDDDAMRTHSKHSKHHHKSPHEIAASLAMKRGIDAGAAIRFTFTLYENQRRWLGIGWTASMLAYERAAWTDEHLNATPNKDAFVLPEVEGGHAKWRWVEDSEWAVEEHDTSKDGESDDGWIYYDNKWRDGRRGKDGWGRYTRRRKWMRDAELVEVDASERNDNDHHDSALASSQATLVPRRDEDASTTTTLVDKMIDENDTGTSSAKDDTSSTRRKKRWFGGSGGPVRRNSQVVSDKSVALSGTSSHSRDDDDADFHVPLKYKDMDRTASWGLSDDAEMALG